MCWSREASLATFALGWGASAYLIFRNGPADRLWGFFFLWVTGMQFLEFLQWSDQACGELNNVASQIAWFQNLAQPLVGGALLAAYVYTGATLAARNTHSHVPLQALAAAMTAYTVAFLAWIFAARPYQTHMCAKPAKDCAHHLQWPWTKDFPSWIWIAYFAALAVIVLASLKNRGAAALSAYLVVTCVVASLFMPFSKAVGSWWCVFAIGAPVLKAAVPLAWFKG